MRSGRALLVLAVLLLAALNPATGRADGARVAPQVHLSLDQWLVVPGLVYSLGLGQLDGVDDLLFEPADSEPGLPGVRFRSAFTEKEERLLAGTEPEWRLFGYEARASWRLWGGAVSSRADLIGFALGERTKEALVMPTPRMVEVDLTGVWDALETGVRIESVSPGLEPVIGRHAKRDQEGTEAWLALRVGPARLRAAASEASDNVLQDARRPRTSRSEGGLMLELTPPRGARVWLGASEGTWERAPARRAAATSAASASGEFERLFATLYYYGGPHWNASLSATATESVESRPAARASTTLSHDLSVSFQPTPTIGITPTLGVSQHDATADAGTRVLWASLSAWAAPLAGPLDLMLYADWNRSRTLDDLYDGRSLSAGASLTYHLRRRPPTTTLTLEGGYYRYLDAVSGAGRYEDVVGLVIFKLASF